MENETNSDRNELAALEGAASNGPDPDALFAAIAEQVENEKGVRAWLRGQPTSLRLAVGAFAVALVALIVSLTTRRVDMGIYPGARFALEVGAIAILNLSVLWVALRPAHRPPLPGWVWLAAAAACVLAPFALGLAPQAHVGHAASLAGAGDDLFSRATACFLFGLGAGAPIALLMFSLDREEHGAARRIALAAGVAGTAGVIALSTHCPITQPIHLLAGHGPVVVGMMATYAALALSLSPEKD